MSVNFVETTAGLAAATIAGISGPQINFATFQVGSAYGYTPLASDTGINGTLMYSGTILTALPYNSNTMDIVLQIPENVGPFQFGEIAIFLSTGTMFCKCAYPTAQSKVADSTNGVGGVITIHALIQLSANIPTAISYTINNIASVPIFSGSAVTGPNLLGSTINEIIITDYTPTSSGTPDNPGTIVATRESNTQWAFDSYTKVSTFTPTAATGTTGTTALLTSAQWGVGEPPYSYIIQNNIGQMVVVQWVDPSTGNFGLSRSVSWLNTTDTFTLYVSSAIPAQQLNGWQYSRSGAIPHVGLGVGAISGSLLAAQQYSSRDGGGNVSGNAYQFQRYFDNDTTVWSGTSNNLRAVTTVGNGSTTVNVGNVWSFSGEMVVDNLVNVTGSVTAVSGVIQKGNLGTDTAANCDAIAGHFQVRCPIVYATPADVTPVVGTEMNLPVVGYDSSTANDGFGNRSTLELYARSDFTSYGTAGWSMGETGSAIFIQHTATTTAQDSPGYYRYGLVIIDGVNYGAPAGPLEQDAIHIGTFGLNGIRISGANTNANIMLDEMETGAYGYPNYGLICNSANYASGSAIRIQSMMAIAFDQTNTIQLRWNPTTKALELLNAGVVKQSWSTV